MEAEVGDYINKHRIRWNVPYWNDSHPISKTFRLLVYEGFEVTCVLSGCKLLYLDSSSSDGSDKSPSASNAVEDEVHRFTYELSWTDGGKPLLYNLRFHLWRGRRLTWEDETPFSEYVSRAIVPPRGSKTTSPSSKSIEFKLDIEFKLSNLRIVADDFVPMSALTQPLLNEKLLTDFVVVSGNETFDCHRNILAVRSDFFKTMLTGQFKEAKERRVEMNAFDSSVVKLIIDFIYLDTVREEAVTWDLFEAARMYSLPGLQDLCLEAFRKNLSVANCCAMLEAAFKHGLNDLFDHAADFLSKNKWDVTRRQEWKAITENNELITRIYLAS